MKSKPENQGWVLEAAHVASSESERRSRSEAGGLAFALEKRTGLAASRAKLLVFSRAERAGFAASGAKLIP